MFADNTLKLVLTQSQLFEYWVLVTGRISTCGFVKHSLPGDTVISVDVVLSVVSCLFQVKITFLFSKEFLWVT